MALPAGSGGAGGRVARLAAAPLAQGSPAQSGSVGGGVVPFPGGPGWEASPTRSPRWPPQPGREVLAGVRRGPPSIQGEVSSRLHGSRWVSRWPGPGRGMLSVRIPLAAAFSAAKRWQSAPGNRRGSSGAVHKSARGPLISSAGGFGGSFAAGGLAAAGRCCSGPLAWAPVPGVLGRLGAASGALSSLAAGGGGAARGFGSGAAGPS